MKVGILTFHCADNYGAMLQAYGLKTYLRGQGVQADIVRYEPPFMTGRHWLIPYVPMGNISRIRWLAWRRGKAHISLGADFFRQRANMRRFRKRYLTCGQWGKLLFAPWLKWLPCRYYIVGSDQIWNPDITCGLRRVYFGAFESRRKERVIAYAASMGGPALAAKYDGKFSELVRHLDAISVREEEAAAYVRRFYPGEVEAVLDPVFFLEREAWERVEDPPRREGYILVYTTENNPEMTAYAQRLSEEKSLPVVELRVARREQDAGFTVDYTAGPAQFLGYIHKADYVVTNSFHAVAFSIIYQKQFLVFLHSSLGARIKNVLRIHGLESRLHQPGRDDMIDAGTDWGKVREKTAQSITRSEEFLRRNLS